jgi:putative tryptophan/tyrosine transport system substrate-binding protein
VRISDKRVRSGIVCTLVSLLPLAAVACGSPAGSGGAGASAGRCERVGVFLIADALAIRDTVRGAKAGLLGTPGVNAAVVTFTEKNAQGDAGNMQSIARAMAASDGDMFLVLGSSATIALEQLEKRRPIITLGMGDPMGAKVARSLDQPGGNVTGSTDYLDPAAQLDQLLQVKPVARRIGTVYDPSQPNAVKWVRDFDAATRARGVELVQATAGNSGEIGIAARSLVGRVDALIIGNDANTLAGVAAIAATAKQAKIPLYLNGGDYTVPGVFATLGPDYFEVGRLAGENAGKVCTGRSPGSLAFARPKGVTWGVNTTTMSSLGLTVPDSILRGAAK